MLEVKNIKERLNKDGKNQNVSDHFSTFVPHLFDCYYK